MGTRTRRLGALAATLWLLIATSACAVAPQPVVTVLPTDGSAVSTPSVTTPGPRPTATTVTIAPTTPPPPPNGAPDVSDCGGRAVILTDGSESFVLSGACPEVQVQGGDLVVDVSAADVGSMTLSGDRIALAAGTVASLTIRGNDVEVTAGALERLEVHGDRNAISATSTVRSVQFDGNDNTLRSTAGVGGVIDNGGRNVIG